VFCGRFVQVLIGLINPLLAIIVGTYGSRAYKEQRSS
jgi:hypothetical protein